jgi:hypothetical protein
MVDSGAKSTLSYNFGPILKKVYFCTDKFFLHGVFLTKFLFFAKEKKLGLI